MSDFDKWLIAAKADDPVSKVARRALKHRLRAVTKHLKGAEGATSRNPGPVHQLRVWSRRASAAQRMFAQLLPRRKSRKLRRTLRKLRHVGGRARDCDLLLQSLAEEHTTAATVRISRRLRMRREEAQRPIDRMKEELVDGGKFKRQRKQLLAAVRWRKKSRKRQEPSFAHWARTRLEKLIAELLAFEATDLQQDERMHRMRIVGKRLRYAAELSASVFPRVLSEGLYDQLVDLQDRLGDAVDHLAHIQRMQTLLDESSEADRAYLVAGIAKQQSQLAQKRRKLTRWWTAARRRAFESQWRGALRGEI